MLCGDGVASRARHAAHPGQPGRSGIGRVALAVAEDLLNSRLGAFRLRMIVSLQPGGEASPRRGLLTHDRLKLPCRQVDKGDMAASGKGGQGILYTSADLSRLDFP